MLGRPTISWPALLLAKLAVGLSLALMLWKLTSSGLRLPAPAAAVFLVLALVGLLLLVAGIFRLGSNLRVGLPDEQTTLVTSGVYRFSRNPIYAGVFCLMGASLICAFSWLNVAAVLAGGLLHHRIVLAEEKFLASRFAGYDAYRRRVRRYL